jgi:hypothetical protein
MDHIEVQEGQLDESSNSGAMAVAKQEAATAIALLENAAGAISQTFEGICSIIIIMSIPSSSDLIPLEEFKHYASSIQQVRDALSDRDGSNFPTQIKDVLSLTADHLEMASGLTEEIESYYAACEEDEAAVEIPPTASSLLNVN